MEEQRSNSNTWSHLLAASQERLDMERSAASASLWKCEGKREKESGRIVGSNSVTSFAVETNGRLLILLILK
jgi:hypothetical protein